MKKRIVILSCIAASFVGVFLMPSSFPYGTSSVLAETINPIDDRQSNSISLEELSAEPEDTDSVAPADDGNTSSDEDLAAAAASISDEQILSYAQQNFDVLINMDLDSYNPETSADAAMVNDWYYLHEQAGAYLSTDATSVEREERKIKGIIDTTCENMKVRFVVTFDVENGLESITANEIVEEKVGLGEAMANAGVNTLLGMGTVFVMLIVMAYIISLMKYIPKLLASKQKAPEPVAIATPAVSAPPIQTSVPVQEEDLSNDEELVAVISAAIAAYEGEASVDGFVVRSIRKHSRN